MMSGFTEHFMKMFGSRCASRPWTSTLLLLTVGVLAIPDGASAQDVDLTGDWVFTVESPNGTGERKVTFVQDGNELSGEIASSRAAGPLSGTIDGDKVTFVAMVMMESGPFEITYTGTVKGDEMEGAVAFGTYGSGTFKGHRVEPATETP
jgi:hypothetical protein